jgi:hypothetical protein
LKHVLRHQRAGRPVGKAEHGIQLDEAAVSMVIGMLDTASLPREPIRGR